MLDSCQDIYNNFALYKRWNTLKWIYVEQNFNLSAYSKKVCMISSMRFQIFIIITIIIFESLSERNPILSLKVNCCSDDLLRKMLLVCYRSWLNCTMQSDALYIYKLECAGKNVLLHITMLLQLFCSSISDIWSHSHLYNNVVGIWRI